MTHWLNPRMALHIARKAHTGQKRKHGGDYIWHPVAVALDSLVVATGEGCVAVALLHDVIEDSYLTLGDISRFGASAIQVDALDALTHRGNESNENYLARILDSHLASVVKLADSRHNYDELPMLLATPGVEPFNKRETREETYARLRAKYQRNIRLLETALGVAEFTRFLEDRDG